MICQKCGSDIGAESQVCNRCGFHLSSASVEQAIPAIIYLSKYYKDEFRNIYESKEVYKGKFNLAAFIFSGLWAISKGLYLNTVIWAILAAITGGIAGIFYIVYIGTRGNWLYYNLKKNDSQPFL